ncbi:MAG: hypothetical protein AMQ22_01077 [Candidatus Methanofastidiosum methylothiophilum]|uniref:Uncharacterized protein n=1 Tax=Candidatus Methanofastidiosum methylothiophilum TaxID=1705564 RepID=A0A150J425_9EURY|nr:MAG: hypothetical protein AMQ22_01077 [Candidatus Methanofastidiosum methylthiophilus]
METAKKLEKEKKIWQDKVTLNPGDIVIKEFNCENYGMIEEGKYDFIGTAKNYGVSVTLKINRDEKPANLAGGKTNLNTEDYANLSIPFKRKDTISIILDNSATADVIEILYSLRGYILR